MLDVPNDLVVYIGGGLFMTVLIMVNLSRNGYSFGGKYINDLADYFNGTQEIINTEEGNNHYNDISNQFNSTTVLL